MNVLVVITLTVSIRRMIGREGCFFFPSDLCCILNWKGTRWQV